jgi:hypothetical protein
MIACLAFALLIPIESAAKGHAPAACKSAYDSGLDAQARGHLRQAREYMQSCAKAACGAGYLKKCTAEAARLESVIPMVAPVITDESGTPVLDGQVSVDGEPLTSQLDGRTYPIDPGLHEFSFSSGGAVLATQKIVIVQGQRGPVSISVHMPAKSAAKPSAPSTPAVAKEEETKAASETASESASSPRGPSAAKLLLPSLVVGTIGAGTLAAAVLVDIWGNNDNSLLVSRCKPNCPPSSAEHIHTLYTTADILFGTGVVALGVSTWLFVLSRDTEAAPPSPRTAYVLDVKPTLSGAVGTISGTF